MSKRILYIVCPAGEGAPQPWKWTRDGAVMAYADTQDEAIQHATLNCRGKLQLFGQKSELQIRGKDGQIKDTRTYGDDPRETKG